MQKRKVAVYGVKYYPSRGGTSRIAESIIRELKGKYDITLYCYRHKTAENPISGIRLIQFPKLPFGGVGVFFYFLLSALHILFSRTRYDIIHVHKIDTAIFMPLLRLKAKVVATSHGLPQDSGKWKTLGKAYFNLMERIFVSSQASLTSVSKPVSEHFHRQYHKDVQFIPNGIQITEERDYAAAKALLLKHGVQGDYLFFAARRIIRMKGCHTFLEAMQKINYTGHIVIAGEENHGAAYLTRLKKLAKGLNVHFIGFVDRMPTLMALIEKAKYFIFPSELEGLSMMLLEVGSNGKTPLICSDIPENTQVFNNEHVLFFRDRDAGHLAEQFLWAEAHPEEMKLKMALAREHVINEFSINRVAEKYDNLFQELCPV